MIISRFCKIILFTALGLVVNASFAESSRIVKTQMLGDVLYHGSPNTSITVFEPRDEHIRKQGDGAVVFASPSIKIASCYLFKWDDSWVHQFVSTKDDSGYEVYMVISDRKRFDEQDLGGAIYLLPTEGFYSDEKTGLGIYEMISHKKVIPFTALRFFSALETMKLFSVKVFFMSPEQFQSYKKIAGTKRQEFLDTLKN